MRPPTYILTAWLEKVNLKPSPVREKDVFERGTGYMRPEARVLGI